MSSPSSPISSSHSSSLSSSPPTPLLATVLSVSEPSTAICAHILKDRTSIHLASTLQSHLTTLGIGSDAVHCDVRAELGCDGSTNPGKARYGLKLEGRLNVTIGSLFNIMVHKFVCQHPEIISLHRDIHFFTLSRSASVGTDATSGMDNEPILKLKIEHLARCMTAARQTVVYVPEQPYAPIPTDTESSVNAPTLLSHWYSHARIAYVVSSSTDGQLASAGLPDHALSELYGNRFRETCTQCRASYIRSSEVRRQMPNPHHFTGRRCEQCGTGAMCDAVIERNEALPRAALQRAMLHASESDLALCLGPWTATSGPSDLLRMSGCAVMQIHSTGSAHDERVLQSGGVLIRGRIDVVLARVQAELSRLDMKTPSIGQRLPLMLQPSTIPSAVPGNGTIPMPLQAFSLQTAPLHRSSSSDLLLSSAFCAAFKLNPHLKLPLPTPLRHLRHKHDSDSGIHTSAGSSGEESETETEEEQEQGEGQQEEEHSLPFSPLPAFPNEMGEKMRDSFSSLDVNETIVKEMEDDLLMM